MSSLGGSFSNVSSIFRTPTVLEQLIEEINFQRTKEMRQLIKDGYGSQGTTYWTDLFVRHFLFHADLSIDCDDLLFFVRKKHVKGSSRFLPKFETEVEVFRKDSRKLPIGDPDIDWEETVYLNLIIHQFDYTLTLATCTRTSPRQLQVLKRHSQKVYASPSRRRMDAKGDTEEMTYPYICFMVDNFDEVFADILVRDGEMICVELLAADRDGASLGVIFLGSIRYDALKRVYDARASAGNKMASKMSFGFFGARSRVEYVRMKGPDGKGHAEIAVSKPPGAGCETPTSEPGICAVDLWDQDWDDPEEMFLYRHERRLSDPSANINYFMRGAWKTRDSAGARARSENEGLDSLGASIAEVEAGDVRDELDEGAYNPLWTMRGFTQTFHMWKETKRAQSVPLNAFLTYVTLPWWTIARGVVKLVPQAPVSKAHTQTLANGNHKPGPSVDNPIGGVSTYRSIHRKLMRVILIYQGEVAYVTIPELNDNRTMLAQVQSSQDTLSDRIFSILMHVLEPYNGLFFLSYSTY